MLPGKCFEGVLTEDLLLILHAPGTPITAGEHCEYRLIFRRSLPQRRLIMLMPIAAVLALPVRAHVQAIGVLSQPLRKRQTNPPYQPERPAGNMQP
ncbi:MAG: hypothetical protein BWY82_02402 [Verrucomicrobia bacterium ADurb.Bin474]|nr:MAG: hypothetical protein BWY82_02402 [Verrucomicrobia bacterium ADurb.Bin474]